MTRILAMLVAVAFSGSVLAAPPFVPQSPMPAVQADKAGKAKAKKKAAKAKKAKKSAPKTK